MAEHKAKIIDSVGPAYYEILLKGIDSDLERYNYARQFQINQFEIQGINDETISQLITIWEEENSPYYEIQRRIGALKEDGTLGDKVIKRNGRFVVAGKNAIHPRTLPNEK